MAECQKCTVGYPARRKGENCERGLMLKRDDGRSDMPWGTARRHVRPNGKVVDKVTLYCRDCPKRCGQPAIELVGRPLCAEHSKAKAISECLKRRVWAGRRKEDEN